MSAAPVRAAQPEKGWDEAIEVSRNAMTTLAVLRDVDPDSLTPSEGWFLFILASRAGPSGECWITYKQLAHDTKMSERQTQYMVKALIARGLLLRKRRPNPAGPHPNLPNLYRVDVGAIKQLPHRARREEPDAGTTEAGGQNEAEPGHTPHPAHGAQPAPCHGAQPAPSKTRSPKNSDSKKERGVRTPPSPATQAPPSEEEAREQPAAQGSGLPPAPPGEAGRGELRGLDRTRVGCDDSESTEGDDSESAEGDSCERTEGDSCERTEGESRENSERAEGDSCERAEGDDSERAESDDSESTEGDSCERTKADSCESAEGDDSERAESDDSERAESDDSERAESDDSERAESERAKADSCQRTEGDGSERAEGDDGKRTEGDDSEGTEADSCERAEADSCERAEGDGRKRIEGDGCERDSERGQASDPSPEALPSRLRRGGPGGIASDDLEAAVAWLQGAYAQRFASKYGTTPLPQPRSCAVALVHEAATLASAQAQRAAAEQPLALAGELLRDCLGHWLARYLDDAGSKTEFPEGFLRHQRHPLRFLRVSLHSYGLPWDKPKPAAAPSVLRTPDLDRHRRKVTPEAHFYAHLDPFANRGSSMPADNALAGPSRPGVRTLRAPAPRVGSGGEPSPLGALLSAFAATPGPAPCVPMVNDTPPAVDHGAPYRHLLAFLPPPEARELEALVGVDHAALSSDERTRRMRLIAKATRAQLQAELAPTETSTKARSGASGEHGWA